MSRSAFISRCCSAWRLAIASKLAWPPRRPRRGAPGGDAAVPAGSRSTSADRPNEFLDDLVVRFALLHRDVAQGVRLAQQLRALGGHLIELLRLPLQLQLEDHLLRVERFGRAQVAAVDQILRGVAEAADGARAVTGQAAGDRAGADAERVAAHRRALSGAGEGAEQVEAHGSRSLCVEVVAAERVVERRQ